MNRRSFLIGSASVVVGTSLSTAQTVGDVTTMLEKDAAGWIDVAPGAKLEGWTEYPWFDTVGNAWRTAHQWHMNTETGILLCDGLQPLSEYHSMFLTDKEYADCIFHVEWKFTKVASPPDYKGYNSGVFVRMFPPTPEVKVMQQVETGSYPGHAGFWRGGKLDHGVLTQLDTEVKVDGQWTRVDCGFPHQWHALAHSIAVEPDPEGVRGAYDAGGILRSVYEVGISAPVHPAGEWNTYEIVCRGSKLEVWTNGEESSRVDNCKVPKGRIGLENEGHRIEFRNLRVKELS